MTEIKGYENYILYEDGKIYNKKRKKFLSPSPNNDGYLRVQLWKKGKEKKYLVHRLLGLHFIPNPNNYPQIDHIDRNNTNNNLSNLRWATNSMNGKNKGDFKNNKLKQKYIYEYDQEVNGKYYYYYKFQIKGIITKLFSCNEYDLDDVIKYRDEYLLNNKI